MCEWCASGCVLAYAQVTRMCAGNKIDYHLDSSHFGDVIITVGLCGEADVLLRRKRNQKQTIGGSLTASRYGSAVPEPPDWLKNTLVGEGDAYVLAGLSRWRFEHSISAVVNQVAAPEYGPGVARVAVTLRYFRRSFCHVETRRLLREVTLSSTSSSSTAPQLTEAEQRARDWHEAPMESNALIDVKAVTNPSQNPFTYPAIVLGRQLWRPAFGGSSSVRVQMLRVQYLCDRRTPSTAAEAVGEFDWVDEDTGTRCSAATIQRCCEEHTELRERLQWA